MIKLKTKTIKLKDDLWLFAINAGNADQTHRIIPKGEKVKLFYNPKTGFGSVFADHWSGKKLEATFTRMDLADYGVIIVYCYGDLQEI